MATPVEGHDAEGSAPTRPPVLVAGKDGSGNTKSLVIDSTGATTVVGNVADGAADSGNPVKVGAVVRTAAPSGKSNANRADMTVGPQGGLFTMLGVAGLGDGTATSACSVADFSGNSRVLGVGPYLFNGTQFDRQRGNQDNLTAIASAVYNSTQTQADQTNYNWRGITVVMDATAVVSAGSFTLEIDGKDPVSGKYYSLLTGAAVSTVSTNVYSVYPGITATANVSASAVLPRTFRIKATFNSGTSLTFSVGYMLLV